MAEYDLTQRISNYLDKHLILPLLEYISVKNVYDEDSLLKSKLDVLMRTSMLDYAADTYQTLYNTDVPDDFSGKRAAVLDRIQSFEVKLEPVKMIFSPETMKEVAQCKNAKDLLSNLETKYNFKTEMLDDLYDAARLFYDIGNYNTASEYLRIVRQLVTPGSKRHLEACWGRLASEILVQNWNEAMDDLEKLKEAVDCQGDDRASPQTCLMQLQQRTWMLHWSLFVFFNHPQGKEKLIEWFMQNPTHLNAIQSLAPHLLRYLTVCVITNTDKKKKSLIRDLVYLIQQESYSYRDPVTEFLECLFVKFDFDGTQQRLRTCETVLPNDFFLTGCYEEFIENARLLMFESFCRIHHSVGISMLADKLNMDVDSAEKWIVKLIRDTRIDAKIDSQKGLIVMGTQKVSPYQQVIERTKTSGTCAHKLLERLRWEKTLDSEWVLSGTIT
ncbi:Eukaryotic translation initiation factor 3 subunit E-B [Paragonimus heterotremus]|uniref:Eukaryotic translation initiation factor 3 subunit E n=1 Tax=Paragonimus heterotremus TaxID=100268 RepID=A0A8J4TC59_9TREM|nr:Eukaryotic translation initiation factor 3 subunit E-B [Paragonimus heterotremus]